MESNKWEERIKFANTPFEITLDGKIIDDINILKSFISEELEKAREEGRDSLMINDETYQQQIRQEERDRIIKIAEGIKNNTPPYVWELSEIHWNAALDSLIEKIR